MLLLGLPSRRLLRARLPGFCVTILIQFPRAGPGDPFLPGEYAVRSWRRWAVVMALCLLAVGGAAAARLALADEPSEFDSFNPYLHRTTGELADPINIIFRGDLAAARVAIPNVLGWKPVAGSEMMFIDYGTSRPTAAQFGLDLGGGSRYHIRLEAVEQQNGQTYVLAGVHRDDLVACGHVGRAFDLARELVASTFDQAGYATSRLSLKNIEPGRQCDGSFTFGDGSAVVIDLPGRQVAR